MEHLGYNIYLLIGILTLLSLSISDCSVHKCKHEWNQCLCLCVNEQDIKQALLSLIKAF